MAFEPPLTLLLNQIQIGVITSYGYETPWACGLVQLREQGIQHRFIQVCEYLDDLERVVDKPLEDDLSIEEELTRRKITNDDVELYFDGEWAIATQTGEVYPITPPQFDAQGFLTWRW